MSPVDLKRELVYSLHRPARRNFTRRHVIMKGLFDTFQADLIDMQSYSKINKNNKYILAVIDIFSKRAFAEPIKTKNAKDVTEAMRKILNQLDVSPKNLHTDLGTEFYNQDFQSLMKKFQINHYSTYSTKKAQIVERFIRTIKRYIWSEFSYQGNHKWINLLPQLINRYNSTVHSTIKMKPNSVTFQNEKTLLNTVYSRLKTVNLNNVKYKIGDQVRISKHRTIFDKSYTILWTPEVFKIKQIRYTNPITYILEDIRKNVIKGCFYNEELQLAKNPDIYLVEKILRRKGNKLFIKWFGYDSSYNSWINKSDIV